MIALDLLIAVLLFMFAGRTSVDATGWCWFGLVVQLLLGLALLFSGISKISGAC